MARKTTKTTTTKTRARKTSPTATDAKPAALVTEPPKVLPAPEIVNTLGKRDLIERVVETSGVKKKDAKPVIEAMLRELGDALSRGDTLNLQPFGKGIVKSRKSPENAEIIELRLRRSRQSLTAHEPAATDPSPTSDDPLAEAAE